MSHSRGTTVVNILGKEYRITCEPGEEDDLIESARLVDTRMQKIRNSGKVIGTDRIAVMTALNLAHELLSQPFADSVDLSDAQDRLHRLRERVEAALNENAQMEIAGWDDNQ